MGALHVVPMYSFISSIMAYSVVSFVLFAVVYGLIGMDRHFDTGNTRDTNWGHAFWHSWCVQSTAMDDVTPKTRSARAAQAVQVFMSWLPMIVLLAPWSIQSK